MRLDDRMAKWVLLLDCGHETYAYMNPKYGIGRGYCNRPGCSQGPDVAIQRIIVGARRISRRERKRMARGSMVHVQPGCRCKEKP